MRMTVYDLWVVTSDMVYSNTSLAGDEAFTDKAEAEVEATSLREKAKAQLPGTSIIYTVKTLSDYLSDVRQDARNEGERSVTDSPGF